MTEDDELDLVTSRSFNSEEELMDLIRNHRRLNCSKVSVFRPRDSTTSNPLSPKFKIREKTFKAMGGRSEKMLHGSRSSTHVLLFSLLFALFSPISVAQICGNGTYKSSDGTEYAIENTSSSQHVTATPYCTPCNNTIPFCYNCVQNDTSTVTCTECFVGYVVTNNGSNCTVTVNPTDNNTGLIIGVVVGVVVGLIVVAGVIILIVCLVRNEKCPRCECFGTASLPPSMPDPEHLSGSYKDSQQSGTGQGRSRYTKEPGSTPPRVESVQYDGTIAMVPQSQRLTYINSSDVNRPQDTSHKRNTKGKDERGEQGQGGGGGGGGGEGGGEGGEGGVYDEEINADDNDDVYVNSPAAQASHPSKVKSKGPGPTKPKPPTKQKKTSHGGGPVGVAGGAVPVLGQRESVFPPDEQVYCNEPDSDNEDDYVNADVNQL